MENLFFDADFRFEKYIIERLLEISDEGERRTLKELMNKTMIPFYEHVEEKYQELGKRLFQTTEAQQQKFEIITGIERRDRIDVTEDAMYPMNSDDLNDIVIDVEEMMEKVRAGRPCTIFRVFIHGDYPLTQRIEREDRLFCGTIYTQEGEYRSEVRLVRNRSYLEQVAELYPIFENNGVNWKTVCMPYLSKFFDVQVVRTECPENESVVKFIIDFEEYSDIVKYNMVPMWNIRVCTEKTGAYPDIAIDRIHYEHSIYRNRFMEGREYLIAEHDVHLWNVFFQEGDMHIVCDDPNPRSWKLLEFNYKVQQIAEDNPVFGNGTNTAETKCIHTKAEVKHFVDSLNCGDLQLVDMEWKETNEIREMKTYSMDSFIADEIRTGRNRDVLLFKFRPKDREDYLNYDIMSYLVSCIQWELPEFLCIGELE